MRLPLQPTGWPRLIAPPSTFSLRLVEFAGRTVEAENLLAEFLVVPGSETAQHLRRKRLVQFPGLDIGKRQLIALQKLGGRQHRAQAHDAGIERRPLAVENDRLRRQPVFGDGLFGREDHPGRTVGDLRGIAGGDLAPGTLEHRLQLCKRLRRRIQPHAIIVIIELAVTCKCGFYLALEPAFRLRFRQPPMALGSIGIRLRTGDAEEMADHFGGLAHVEIGDGIGQPALKPDDRLEIARLHLQRGHDFCADTLGTGKACEPAHALLRPHQRCVAQRLGAARKNKVRGAFANVAVSRVDRLHAGAAIDLHGEGDHLLAHAEPQRGDAGRIHLVGDDVDAAEDDLVESVGRKRLPRQ